MTEEKTTPTLKPLSKKQQAFVEAFLITWSGTKAAEMAGYKHANHIQYQLLHTPNIEAAIQSRLEEMAIAANEVIARLCEQATVNKADFFNFDTYDNGKMKMTDVKWEEIYKRGHLIKGITYNRKGDPVLEFYDAQNALINIGKYLKLFSEQVDLDFGESLKAYIGISPQDWDVKENPVSE